MKAILMGHADNIASKIENLELEHHKGQRYPYSIQQEQLRTYSPENLQQCTENLQ
jgi:hypothetical protein